MFGCHRHAGISEAFPVWFLSANRVSRGKNMCSSRVEFFLIYLLLLWPIVAATRNWAGPLLLQLAIAATRYCRSPMLPQPIIAATLCCHNPPEMMSFCKSDAVWWRTEVREVLRRSLLFTKSAFDIGRNEYKTFDLLVVMRIFQTRDEEGKTYLGAFSYIHYYCDRSHS